jgi:hypothetical protein
MKNPANTLSRSPKEWGSKARKEEDRLRGFRSRGRMDNVNEGLADAEAESEEENP